MFEIESKNQDEIILSTKTTVAKFNVAEGVIDANLSVGKIHGPGEFEIGEMTIRGIQTESHKTIYDTEIGGVHVGIIGANEENLDDIVADILCTSSISTGKARWFCRFPCRTIRCMVLPSSGA